MKKRGCEKSPVLPSAHLIRCLKYRHSNRRDGKDTRLFSQPPFHFCKALYTISQAGDWYQCMLQFTVLPAGETVNCNTNASKSHGKRKKGFAYFVKLLYDKDIGFWTRFKVRSPQHAAEHAA